MSTPTGAAQATQSATVTGQDPLGPVPVNLSSTVLLDRPDVRSAEHTLKAANADIGAARAAFFPSISLTATGGVASTALSSLFSGGASTIWTLAGSLDLPIFDGGSRQADLDSARATQKQSIAAYEETLQTAFQEVADALARRATIQDQLDAEQGLVQAAADAAQLTEAQYKLGAGAYLDVLDAQRTLYSARQTLISTQLTELDNRATLYRVLGGGMSTMPAADALAAADDPAHAEMSSSAAGAARRQ